MHTAVYYDAVDDVIDAAYLDSANNGECQRFCVGGVPVG
jgi:hypothetical protein